MSREIIVGISAAGAILFLILYLMRRRARKLKDFR